VIYFIEIKEDDSRCLSGGSCVEGGVRLYNKAIKLS
jgi:hypothetical protein